MPSAHTQPATRQPDHLWVKTGVRVVFGVIWLIDAILKWLPGFRSDYLDTLKEGRDGQPGWLKPWFNFWINLQDSNATFFAYLVAVIETLIAVALITGFARKITYSTAIVFSLLVWSTAEGFGGPYTSGSDNIGTSIIYALVFAALLGFAYYQGPSHASVDIWLERHISWWHWVAEVGKQHHGAVRSLPEPVSHGTPTGAAPSRHAPGSRIRLFNRDRGASVTHQPR